MRKITSLGLVVFFLLTAISIAFAGYKEEIAVAAKGNLPGASVYEKAGTSPFFLLFDHKGRFMEAIQNPYKGEEGAQEEVAEFLASKGVTAIVAGSFGGPLLISELPPNGVVAPAKASGAPMVEAMKDEGIKAFVFHGSAREAVKKVFQMRPENKLNDEVP